MRNMCLKTMNCFCCCLSLVLQWLLIPNKRLTSNNVFIVFFIFLHNSCVAFYYYYYSFQFTAIKQLACDYWLKKPANEWYYFIGSYCHWWYGKLFHTKLEGKSSSSIVHSSLGIKRILLTIWLIFTKSDIIAWKLNWQMFIYTNAI